MSFRKRWFAVLATVMLGASTAMAVGGWVQTASAQTADAGKDAAAMPAAAVPPPPAPEAAKEAVDNPYGLDALWKGGDFVSKGTLIILVIMSLGTWYIMFTKFYEQFKLGTQAGADERSFQRDRLMEVLGVAR